MIDPRYIIAKFREENSKEKETINFSRASPLKKKRERKKRIFSSRFKLFDNKIVLIILIDPQCIIAKFREENSKENEAMNFSRASLLKKKKKKERKEYFLFVSNHSPR